MSIWQKSKGFLKIFFALAVFHTLEDTFWLVLARFTDIPFWWLIVGVFMVTLISALWVRRHNH